MYVESVAGLHCRICQVRAFHRKTPGPQLTETVVVYRVWTAITSEATLDEGHTAGGRQTDTRGARPCLIFLIHIDLT